MAVVELVWFGIVVAEYEEVVGTAGRMKDLYTSLRNSVQAFDIPFTSKNI